MKYQADQATVVLEDGKLGCEMEYLKKIIKRLEKELDINLVQYKEYHKSCIKQNTTVQALRENFDMR